MNKVISITLFGLFNLLLLNLCVISYYGLNNSGSESVIIPLTRIFYSGDNIINHNVYATPYNSNSASEHKTLLTSAESSPQYQKSDTTIRSAVDGNGDMLTNGGSTLSTSIQLSFTGTGSGSNDTRFECSLDGSIFSTCTSPATTNDLVAGRHHEFRVRTVDRFGNMDIAPASFAWTILTPSEGIQQLMQIVQTVNLNHGGQASLTALLNSAMSILRHNNPNNNRAECSLLNAFTHLASVHVTDPSQAAHLIHSAQNIKASSHCNR
jgi:hypothetical protein